MVALIAGGEEAYCRKLQVSIRLLLQNARVLGAVCVHLDTIVP